LNFEADTLQTSCFGNYVFETLLADTPGKYFSEAQAFLKES